MTDLAAHLALLGELPTSPNPALRRMFEPGVPLYSARAPGRLDVMGGIADYSGSLVLQLPIAEAAFAAVQSLPGDGVIVASLDHDSNAAERHLIFDGRDWDELQRAHYATMNCRLTEYPIAIWAAYVLGPVLVLLRETGAELPGDLRILIDSHVPEGKGVSSSAAVEVATMWAVAAIAGVDLPGEDLARLCQLAENHVVGAPCGIMDQMTAALGRQNELLALRCQPATVEGYAPVPAGVAFWGIDSGIRHAVSGADYTSVRCGAFMGYRIIADAAGLNVRRAGSDPQRVEIEDREWHGYLANISPAEFRERFAARVPEQMSGRDFLARYGGTTDPVTRVEPGRTYAVRQPTIHPIEENARVERFRELLQGPMDETSLREMGDLMAAAHASYSACGLGSDGTELLVQLVREAGPASGLYGAKITGGGSGGTVAVLGRAGAESAVMGIARRYSKIAGRPARVFSGSSPGACATPVRQTAI